MKTLTRFLVAASLLTAATGTPAITITATQDAGALVSALLSGANTGIVVTSSSLAGHQESPAIGGGEPLGTFTSAGTYTNGSNTYGIGGGVVLSSGGVKGIDFQGSPLFPGYDDGPNTTESNGYAYGVGFDIGQNPDPENPPLGTPATPAQELLLDPITGDPGTQTFYDHFDVTELVINFDMQTGFDQVAFKIVFGSEEFPEFVDSAFIDGFGMFLNGVNIAQVNGAPVNIKHPDMTDAITGTELDGILAPGGNPVLTFAGLVNPTGNTLRFIVADTSDGVYDTTVYFSTLEGVGVVPLPASVWLLGTGFVGLLGRRAARRGRCPARGDDGKTYK